MFTESEITKEQKYKKLHDEGKKSGKIFKKY